MLQFHLLKQYKCILQTVKLYERCLIVCANFPDYWIRFVQRMDTEGKVELDSNGLTASDRHFRKGLGLCICLLSAPALMILFGTRTEMLNVLVTDLYSTS